MKTAEFWTLITWRDITGNTRRTTTETTGKPLNRDEAQTYTEPGGIVTAIEFGFA